MLSHPIHLLWSESFDELATMDHFPLVSSLFIHRKFQADYITSCHDMMTFSQIPADLSDVSTASAKNRKSVSPVILLHVFDMTKPRVSTSQFSHSENEVHLQLKINIVYHHVCLTLELSWPNVENDLQILTTVRDYTSQN